MKRLCALCALVILATGCNSLKRLTGGGSDDKKDPANVNGVWEGQINAQGRAQNLGFILIQNGGSITDQSTGQIEWGQTLSAAVTGTVGERDIHLVIDEGPHCTNKITVDGEVNGNTMVVTVAGAGNNVSGCFPDPINQSIALDGSYRSPHN